MNTILIVVIIALKFIIPIFVAFFPFAAGWANFVLDTVDGDLLIPLGMEDATYQPIDKFADLFTYVGMVAAAWKFKWKIRSWIYGLFALRLIGQIGFFITENEAIFFYFPNFLEPLFLFYASTIAIKNVATAERLWDTKKWLILALVFVYKMQDEYFTHIGNIDRTEFFSDLFSVAM